MLTDSFVFYLQNVLKFFVQGLTIRARGTPARMHVFHHVLWAEEQFYGLGTGQDTKAGTHVLRPSRS